MNALLPHPALERRPQVGSQLCQLVVDWAGRMPESGAIVEPKLDGIRMLYIDGELVTREGSPIYGAEHIAARLRAIEHDQAVPMFFDGEWIVGGSFDATLRHYSAGGGSGDAGHFYCFDALPMRVWRGEDPCEALQDRRGKTERMVAGEESARLGVHPMPWAWCATAAEVEAKAREMIEGGGEGVVVKAPLGTYRRARTSEWQRIKRAATFDCRILGAVPQRDCAWKLGALVVDHGGVRVRVSAGFSEAQRMGLWRDRAALVGGIAEITAMDVTMSGSLRSPRFLRLRGDKTA